MNTLRVLALVSLLVLWSLPAVALAADVPPPVLPDVLQLVIGSVVTFLVVSGLKDFARFTGHDLSGWGTVIAATVTACVVFAINQFLAMAVVIDPTLAAKINALFEILIILLGAMGIKRSQRAL